MKYLSVDLIKELKEGWKCGEQEIRDNGDVNLPGDGREEETADLEVDCGACPAPNGQLIKIQIVDLDNVCQHAITLSARNHHLCRYSYEGQTDCIISKTTTFLRPVAFTAVLQY